MINPNPDAAKHKEIRVWNAEDWLYEDFQVGKRARSIRRTISEGESMLFNAIVLDMHPYVADDVFAKEEGMFGKRLVAGAMVFSLGLGLWRTTISIPSVTDMISCASLNRFLWATRFTPSAPSWKNGQSIRRLGMVKVSYEVFKMPGELVLYCEHLQTVKYRDPAKFKDQLQRK